MVNMIIQLNIPGLVMEKFKERLLKLHGVSNLERPRLGQGHKVASVR